MSNMKGRQAKRIRQESALKRTEAQLAEYKTGLADQQDEVKRAKKRQAKSFLLKSSQNSHKED